MVDLEGGADPTSKVPLGLIHWTSSMVTKQIFTFDILTSKVTETQRGLKRQV